jgi:hypothetical protein
MKVKIFLILSLLLLLGSVSATDTNVLIKTLPGYKAQISFLNPGYAYSLINSYHYTANTNGDIKFVFSSTKDKFDVKIWLTLDGVAITNKKFNDTYTAGQDITLEIYPAWYKPSTNTTNETNTTSTTSSTTTNQTNVTTTPTLTNTTNQTNTTIFSEIVNTKDKKVTALSIEDGKLSITPKIIYYVLGLIVIAMIIIFTVKGIKKDKGVSSYAGDNIRIKKLSEFKKEKQVLNLKDEEKRIASAKRKIEEAESELRQMRNQDKIIAAERKLAEDQRELARLKSGR